MISFFSGGDFRYFFSENIPDFITFPFAWDSALNTGIGHSQIGSLWIISYFNFTLLFNRLGLSWNWISLLFWILPAILLSFLSSFLLFNYLFREKIKYSLLAGIIYTFNTYFLMILTGGQLGVSLAYSLAPLVLLRFIKIMENLSLRNVLISGLILGLQLIFDPRIVYVTLVIVFLYALFNFFKLKIKEKKIYFVTPFFISILLNIFWILPLLLIKNSPIPEGFNSIKGFEFFSFSDFSHALSLLHPNWPENIFGKVYFLKPEFLILPIIAFSALLFNKTRIILFFCLLALIGAFLAKGANPPFGQINIWLFQNFPGMSMFRDPTKWYILIVLSYSILIPYAVREISKYFRFSFILFTIYFLYLATSIFVQVKFHQVPKEYVQLKNFLVSQPEFFRTLWIPQWQRFGYFSNLHPAVGREEVFEGNAEKQIDQLRKPDMEKTLRNLSVKYIIVPSDSESEIFLKDRKYDELQYMEIVKKLAKIDWLKYVSGFGKIAIFEIPNPKDHFWSKKENLIKSYMYINPTKYKVSVENVKKGDTIVFTENFDAYWFARKIDPSSTNKIYLSKAISSNLYENKFNSFVLRENGNYTLEIYYLPQKYVEIGSYISIGALAAVLLLLIASKSQFWLKIRNNAKIKQ